MIYNGRRGEDGKLHPSNTYLLARAEFLARFCLRERACCSTDRVVERLLLRVKTVYQEKAVFDFLYLGSCTEAIADIETHYILPVWSLSVWGLLPNRMIYQNYETIFIEEECDLILQSSGMKIIKSLPTRHTPGVIAHSCATQTIP